MKAKGRITACYDHISALCDFSMILSADREMCFGSDLIIFVSHVCILANHLVTDLIGMHVTVGIFPN